MAFNYQNLIGEGSDEELLVFARAAVASLLVTGQSYTTNSGRTLTRADLPQLQETIAWLEARISAAAGSSASTKNLVRLRRA